MGTSDNMICIIYELLIGAVGKPSLRSCIIAHYTSLSQPLYIQMQTNATSLLVNMLALDLLIINFMTVTVEHSLYCTIKRITSSLHGITETIKAMSLF